jgi:hypothetical protein
MDLESGQLSTNGTASCTILSSRPLLFAVVHEMEQSLRGPSQWADCPIRRHAMLARAGRQDPPEHCRGNAPRLLNCRGDVRDRHGSTPWIRLRRRSPAAARQRQPRARPPAVPYRHPQRSIHSRLPQHSPHPTATASLRPRIHARPIRRQAPTGGPLAQPFDHVARSDSHGYDVLRGHRGAEPIGGGASNRSASTCCLADQPRCRGKEEGRRSPYRRAPALATCSVSR